MNHNAAIEGRMPAAKPAQGNALGIASHSDEALDGRDKTARGNLCRPDGACSFHHFPRALPWAGLLSHRWCSIAAFGIKLRSLLLLLACASLVQAGDAFDWNRAKAIFQRANDGATLNADEQKYLDEAKRRHAAGEGPDKPANSDPNKPAGPAIDWTRAKDLHQREQRGEKLGAEDQKYLDEAKRQRGQGGGDGKRPTAPLASPAPEAANLVPLSELAGEYKGQDGGLYGGGKNDPPAAHAALAAKAVAEIKPLNAEGKAANDGKIVLLTIGMSNTTMESSAFKRLADADARKAERLVIVDGAQGGKDATAWARADAPPWSVAEERIKAAGVSTAQVQAVWIKQALIGPQAGFPAEADRLRDRNAEIARLAKQRYPNLRVAFLSSRIYAGFATTKLNPEPYAYESAFAVRSLIQQQIKGEAALNADPQRGEVRAPVLLWGPYIWAGPTPGKGDGLAYAPEDFAPDGTHPGNSGREKVAKVMLDFFTTNVFAKPWFVR